MLSILNQLDFIFIRSLFKNARFNLLYQGIMVFLDTLIFKNVSKIKDME